MKHNHTAKKTFLEHLHEFQIRLTWSVLAVGVLGGASYAFNKQLLAIIQKPLNQTLYYTSPTGGFSFVFKVCAVAGLVLAMPVILYQLFKFLGPLLGRMHKLVITAYTLWSINLAYIGVLFAYFVSLPASLKFLTKFGGDNIQSLITADEYFNFALAYIGGFALLFQLPLIILFINRIKPLSPQIMMGGQRYIILGSFIVSAILTPTPDPINQAIMAVPVILLYQLSIVIVWIANRSVRKHQKAVALASRRPIMPEVPLIIPQKPLSSFGYSNFGNPKPQPLPAKPALARLATSQVLMIDVVMR